MKALLTMMMIALSVTFAGCSGGEEAPVDAPADAPAAAPAE